MTPILRTFGILILGSLLLLPGCESTPQSQLPQPQNAAAQDVPICAYYCPARIDITPLTSLVGSNAEGTPSRIDIYVSLLDTFGCQVKFPATFRFELYEYFQTAGKGKGNRIMLWPDLDLNDPSANNQYWQDFLRAYLFRLDFDRKGNSFLLEVTCTCGFGKRLRAEFIVTQ